MGLVVREREFRPNRTRRVNDRLSTVFVRRGRPSQTRRGRTNGSAATGVGRNTMSSGVNGVLGVLCAPKALKIIGCVVGVLVVYGILQERIMTRPYSDDGGEEFFKYSVFLVLNNRLLAVCAALCILVAIKGNVKPVAPIYSYATVSASNVVATTCQYEALKYVSFPVQTLGKCAK